MPSLSLFVGFPAAAYAAYAAGRGYSGYPSFGLPYPTGKFDLSISLALALTLYIYLSLSVSELAVV